MEITNEIKDLMHLIDVKQSMLEDIAKKKEEVLELEKVITNDLEIAKEKLLALITDDSAVKYDEAGLVAQRFHRANVAYTKDSDVVNWLKANFDGKFVRTKVTESLDKTPLKKELKINTVLQEGLKDFIVNNTTDYIVVTTEGNYAKMLEHMDESK